MALPQVTTRIASMSDADLVFMTGVGWFIGLFFEFKDEDSQKCPAGQRLYSFSDAGIRQSEVSRTKKSINIYC